MPVLSDRIENVLNEGRMILFGGQVPLGFTYRIKKPKKRAAKKK